MNTLSIIGICIASSALIQTIGFCVYCAKQNKKFLKGNLYQGFNDDEELMAGNLHPDTRIVSKGLFKQFNFYSNRMSKIESKMSLGRKKSARNQPATKQDNAA